MFLETKLTNQKLFPSKRWWISCKFRKLYKKMLRQSFYSWIILIVNPVSSSRSCDLEILLLLLGGFRGLESIKDREVCCYMISCKDSINIDVVIDWLIKHSKTAKWFMGWLSLVLRWRTIKVQEAYLVIKKPFLVESVLPHLVLAVPQISALYILGQLKLVLHAFSVFLFIFELFLPKCFWILRRIDSATNLISWSLDYLFIYLLFTFIKYFPPSSNYHIGLWWPAS